MVLIFVIAFCIFQFIVINAQVAPPDPSVNILAFKRKSSEVLKQRGITFDGDIAKIDFDSNPIVMDLQITDEILTQMLSILDEHLKYANDSKKLAALNFTQVIMTKGWQAPNQQTVYQTKIGFALDKGLSENEKTVIRDALHEINRNMFWWCIRFAEMPFDKRGPETIVYLKSPDPTACGNAPMERKSTNMVISLSCVNQQTVLRLTLHVLGLINSIWRGDRDRFLTINWANIKDKYKYNFYPWPLKYINDLDGEEFDYDSVLHFDYTSYAKKPSDPIIKFKQYDPDGRDGTRLSSLDSFKLQQQFLGFDSCTDAPCVDKQYSCPLWQINGYCEHESTSLREEIQKQCAYSCNTCGPPPPPVVVPPVQQQQQVQQKQPPPPAPASNCDEINELCIDWKNDGYCESTSILYPYTKQVCPQSCKTCQ